MVLFLQETQVRFIRVSLQWPRVFFSETRCLGPHRRTNSQPSLQHRKQHVITPCVCVCLGRTKTHYSLLRLASPIAVETQPVQSPLCHHTFPQHTHTHTACLAALRRPLVLQIHMKASVCVSAEPRILHKHTQMILKMVT